MPVAMPVLVTGANGCRRADDPGMLRKSLRTAFACLLPLALMLAAAAPAAAGIMTVTSTADEPDDNWGDGICQTAPGGPCTLRGAVDEAWGNGNAEPDVINLPAGDFALSRGELSVTGAGTVKIAGVGAERTTIRQTGAGRVIHSTAPGGPLLLRDLTIRGGRLQSGSALPDGAGIRAVVGLDLDGVVVYDNRILAGPGGATGQGGGVYAGLGVSIVRSRIVRNEAPRAGGLSLQSETIAITDSVIERNTAWDTNAGGLSVSIVSGPSSSAVVSDSVIARNSAPNGQAGGIEGGGSSTPLLIENSLVHANTASGSAGWVIGGSSQAAAVNSTFSANRASLAGLSVGAIDRQFGAAPPLQLRQVTISGNANAAGPASLRGGGSGQVELKSTLVDGECQNPSAYIVDAASLSTGSSCGMSASADLGLQPLADNGGPTMTHALAAGSPARGLASECAPVDQRGAPRLGPPCDSGAYEFGAVPPPAPAPPSAAPDVDGDGVEDLDDACVDVAGNPTSGCPAAVPSGSPAAPGGGERGPAARPRRLAAFNVTQALLKRGRLIVSARVSPGAGGKCQVIVRRGRQVVRFQVPVRLERISFSRLLPPQLRDARSLGLTLRYPGADSIAPARVSLLAGSRAAKLTAGRAKLTKAGRLSVGGRISPRARGEVEVSVLPTLAGAAKTVELKARIERGRWSLNRRLRGLSGEHRRLLISYRGLRSGALAGAQFSQRLSIAKRSRQSAGSSTFGAGGEPATRRLLPAPTLDGRVRGDADAKVSMVVQRRDGKPSRVTQFRFRRLDHICTDGVEREYSRRFPGRITIRGLLPGRYNFFASALVKTPPPLQPGGYFVSGEVGRSAQRATVRRISSTIRYPSAQPSGETACIANVENVVLRR